MTPKNTYGGGSLLKSEPDEDGGDYDGDDEKSPGSEGALFTTPLGGMVQVEAAHRSKGGTTTYYLFVSEEYLS